MQKMLLDPGERIFSAIQLAAESNVPPHLYVLWPMTLGKLTLLFDSNARKLVDSHLEVQNERRHAERYL